MSSFIKELQHPITGKKQDAFCIDDYFREHRYGYFFKKDGSNVEWNGFNTLKKDDDSYDIFTEEEMKKTKIKIGGKLVEVQYATGEEHLLKDN